MANGQIEIHDPFNAHNGFSVSPEMTQKPISDSENTEDTVEFRLMMAYATRRRPKPESAESGQDSPKAPDASNGTPSIQTEKIPEKKKRRKKKKIVWSRLPKALICLRSLTKDDDNDIPQGGSDGAGAGAGRSAGAGDVTFKCALAPVEDGLDEVAARLVELSDEIPFVSSDLETDTPNGDGARADAGADAGARDATFRSDDVEKAIALLLREAGDRYETEFEDTKISALLANYSFYETVINSFLKRIGLSSDTETLGPKVSTKTQIAVTCEATSRLSVLDTLPMNRLLGHGARFLRSHFSSWAEQHGGYENAFQGEEEEEEIQ